MGVVFLLVLAFGPDVIASGPAIDQPEAVADAIQTPVPTPWLPGSVGVIALALVGASGIWRLRDQSLEERSRIDPLAALGLFLAYMLLSVIAAQVAYAMRGIENIELTATKDIVIVVGSSYLVQVLMIIGYLMLVVRRPRMSWIRSVGVGVIAIALTIPIVMGTTAVLRWIMSIVQNEPIDQIGHSTLDQMLAAPRDGWLIMQMLLVTIGAGIVEEVAYRGVVQQGLRSVGIGPWPAIIATSLIFAGMHASVVDAEAIVGLFLLSLALGWACERTGRLSACTTMHVLFNATNLVLAMLLHAT
ncbi:MAG: type II CAAX endopeptidase family protein [Planctomycetota bacterium]